MSKPRKIKNSLCPDGTQILFIHLFLFFFKYCLKDWGGGGMSSKGGYFVLMSAGS